MKKLGNEVIFESKDIKMKYAVKEYQTQLDIFKNNKQNNEIRTRTAFYWSNNQ